MEVNKIVTHQIVLSQDEVEMLMDILYVHNSYVTESVVEDLKVSNHTPAEIDVFANSLYVDLLPPDKEVS